MSDISDLVNDLYPVVGVLSYGSVLKVVRSSEIRALVRVRGEKQKLSYLSKKSRDYLAFVVNCTQVVFKSMLVLSYGKEYPLSGVRVKSHLNAFLVWFRRAYGGSYLWFLEFQNRGAPHIHLLSSYGGVTASDRVVFANKWTDIVVGGRTGRYCYLSDMRVASLRSDMFAVHSYDEQWADLRSSKGGVGYVTKYATKTRQKIVPDMFGDVGRFFGWSRDVKDRIVEPEFIPMTENELRWALRDLDHKTGDWDIIPKYLWGLSGK